MAQAVAEKSRIKQIGNSLGVIVPAAIRKAGGFNGGDEVSVQCPRPGVITISCIEDADASKAQTWAELQKLVSQREKPGASWPQGKSFKEVLYEARDERSCRWRR